MKKLVVFSVLALLALCTTACTQNRIINLLAGDWEVNSCVIEGEEQKVPIGDITYFIMEYDAADEDQGDVTWLYVEDSGITIVREGMYTVLEDATQLRLEFIEEDAFGPALYFDFEVDKTTLRMEGEIDGGTVIIEAERD